MEIAFTDKAKQHLAEWKKSGNKAVMKKIEALLININETPFYDIGKPEELKYDWAGFWLRRITDEHRLIYNVTGDVITVYALKGHYE